MKYSLNNTYINQALQLGSAKNVKQLFLAECDSGSLDLRGDLDKRLACMLLQELINKEDAVRGDWVERSSPSFPKLPRQFQYLVKNPRMVKNALTTACSYLMAFAGIKLGHDTFLAWHYPLEKAFLVHTAGLVTKLPNTFTLSMIIDWTSLQGTSISNGRLSALKVNNILMYQIIHYYNHHQASSGVQNWLSACKVILESLFLIAGHNIDEWVEEQMDGAVSSPAGKMQSAGKVEKLKHGFKKPSAKKSTDTRCILKLYFR